VEMERQAMQQVRIELQDMMSYCRECVWFRASWDDEL
jgi:hypothetical protein